ncbi:MAG: hypothetical protein JSS28_04960 [Proteobacteria bacterium]|nr:hypothetical protein [Pseudomonadota bacterium]
MNLCARHAGLVECRRQPTEGHPDCKDAEVLQRMRIEGIAIHGLWIPALHAGMTMFGELE